MVALNQTLCTRVRLGNYDVSLNDADVKMPPNILNQQCY